jgi:hypothetical protein
LYIKSIGLGRGTPDSSYKENNNIKKKRKKKKIYNNENTSLYIKVFPPPGYLAG